MRTELPAGTILRFPDGQTFELLDVIGGGGLGLIYEAREAGTQLYAAIKEVYPIRGFVREAGEIRPAAGTAGAETLDRLKRSVEERETLLSQQAGRRNYQVLHTRGICHRAELLLPDGTRLTDVNNTYTRMDSLREKGVTLREHIRRCRERGPMTMDSVLAVMRTVLDAYAALHADGVLHGDCQTGNLFLLKAGEAEGPGTACIIDFGSARQFTYDGGTEEIRDEIYSTDGFCPPELLTRGREAISLTAACDVWALGFLLLELLTGRALQGTDITRFLMTHPREKRLSPGEAEVLGCSPAEADMLNRILKTALANEPERRYPTAGAMREALRALERCLKLDLSAGPDRHLLWEGSIRFARKNVSLFRTEHVPMLVESLPVKKLTVYASMGGDRIAPAAELLRRLALGEPTDDLFRPAVKESDEFAEWMDEDLLAGIFGETPPWGRPWTVDCNRREKPGNNHVYLHAPGGAGKSFATAELFNEFLESGRRVPLYLDLARFTAGGVEAAGTPEGAISRLLAEQMFDDALPSTAEALETLFSEERVQYCLVLDNLHKVDKAAYPAALEAVNHIACHWRAVWLLMAGRAEDPARRDDGGGVGQFCPAQKVALQLLPKKDLWQLTETVFQKSVAALPKEDVYRKFGSAALWGGREMLNRNRETLGLPLFFMRYLELLTRDPREIELPNGTAELLSLYFGQREYDANGRSVHDFLRRHMPWVGYQYMRSGRPEHTRQEIAGWLEESYGRLRYRPEHAEEFFHDAVENLAVLTPAGEDGLRFVHDCYQEYFSAAAIAGHVRQALDEGDTRPLRKVNHPWTGKTAELWLNLCAGEVENGRYRRICEPAAVAESLRALLWEKLERSREEAGCIPENVLFTMCKVTPRGAMTTFGESFETLFGLLDSPGWNHFPLGFRYTQALWERDLPWLWLGAEVGDPEMQFCYGHMLWRGAVDIPGDVASGFEWIRRAAEQGHAEAQCVVAYACECGIAGEKDPAAALTWYHRAAENGQPDALARLALLRVKGELLPWDPGEAEKCLLRLEHVMKTVMETRPSERASAPGCTVETQYLLGRAFLLGEDTEPDAARGLRWLHEAGRNGSAEAMLLLGLLYEKYADTEGGRAAARKWYEAAAKSGDPEAAYRFADLCAAGMGTKVWSGLELAVYWFGVAAAGGYPGAEARIDAIFAANPHLADYLRARPWRVEECCCPERSNWHWIKRS